MSKVRNSFVFVGLFLMVSAQPANAQEKLSVFVSIAPQKYFVERVAGELVDVHVMVPSGASPATYEPTPKQMAELSRAKVYFRIGVPFEERWMDNLKNSFPELQVADLRDNILLRKMKDGYQILTHDNRKTHVEEHDHHHDHDHSHGGLDPHIWLSPSLVQVQAANIANIFFNIFPAQVETIQKNTAIFQNELQELSLHIRQKLRELPTRQMMVFHPAWGYFADEFQLIQVPIEIEGKEPSIREMTKLVEIAKKEKISVIFVQKQFSDKMARALAQTINADVVTIDPLAEDYIVNMMRITQTLEAHLKDPNE
ncbi:MAG: zinc ABC transporter substrate-binding protein [Candidatus Omnitrophica bacterium]|nr:zinc ABC transporter substrate-binding protein [Candidatus Omnitrophota bacterium]